MRRLFDAARITVGSIVTLASLLVFLSPFEPLVSKAWAGETFIGRISVSDAGSVNNANTGYGSAGCATQDSASGAGACAQAFRIGLGNKLTIKCSSACCVSVNRATTDAGICLPLAADEKFPTSVASVNVQSSVPDGGTYAGGLVAITPPPGSAACECGVFTRSGTE